MNRLSRLCPTAMVALILAIWLMLVQPVAAQTLDAGDVNGDGAVNVIDVQLTVNVALGVNANPTTMSRADLNGDGVVNVLDVQRVVNIVLNGNKLPITLPTASAAPLSPLNIATSGLTQGSPISVTFSDSSVGYSAQATPFRVDPDGTVWVGVPIYINPKIGVTSGNVQVTVSQGAKSSSPQPLAIQNLPTLADLGQPLGRLSHAFFVFAAQVIANRVEELDQTSILLQNVGQSKDMSAARSSLMSLLQRLIMARGDVDRILLNNTVVINQSAVTTSDGIPIQFDASSLQAMDRIVGAWALQQFASSPPLARSVPTLLVSADPATIARAKLIPASPTNKTGLAEFISANPTSTTYGAKLILVSTTSTTASTAVAGLGTVEVARDIASQANDPNSTTYTRMIAAIGGVATVVTNVTDDGTTVHGRAEMVGNLSAIAAMGPAFYHAGRDLSNLRKDMSQGKDTTQDLANLQADKSALLEASGALLIQGAAQMKVFGVGGTAATLGLGSAALILIGDLANEINRIDRINAETESFLAIQKYLNSVHRASGEAKVSGKINDSIRTVATPPDSTRFCCFGANSLSITGLGDDSGNYAISVPLGMSNTNYRSISITVSNSITGALRGSAVVDLSGVNTGNPVIVPVSAPVIAIASSCSLCTAMYDQCYPSYAVCSNSCGLNASCINACISSLNSCLDLSSQCFATCR